MGKILIMTLFEECLAALKTYETADKTTNEKIFSQLHLTFYGRIDLNKYTSYFTATEKELSNFADCKCYIVYCDPTIPIIKTDFKNILANLDDVLAVASDTWIICENSDRIIEFYHENEITVINI